MRDEYTDWHHWSYIHMTPNPWRSRGISLRPWVTFQYNWLSMHLDTEKWWPVRITSPPVSLSVSFGHHIIAGNPGGDVNGSNDKSLCLLFIILIITHAFIPGSALSVRIIFHPMRHWGSWSMRSHLDIVWTWGTPCGEAHKMHQFSTCMLKCSLYPC